MHKSILSDPQKLKILPGGVSPKFVAAKLPKRTRKWCLNDFDIGKNLGKGKFGSVYLAREKESRFMLALKIMFKIHFSTVETMQQLQREIEIQTHLKHPNIIRLYGYFYDEKRVYIMLEYAPFGELAIEMRKFRFSVNRCATYVYQFANALAYCHERNVIHRDINPANALVGVNGEIKVADFGCAVHSPASKRTAVWGTLEYLAPEMTSVEFMHDFYCDLWSLGIITYEMVSGVTPFKTQSEKETLSIIQEANVNYDHFHCECVINFLSKLLQKNPTDRITAQEVCHHPWIIANAEKSLTRCQAALDDWESANHGKNLPK